MNRRARWVVGALLAIGGAIGTRLASTGRYRDPSGDHAVVRLAWSGRPERLERCRRLTDAELEKVPIHMRQRVQCEGRSATYRLQVMVDRQAVAHETISGGGARRDRPMHLLRDYVVEPGLREIEVSVIRIESGGFDSTVTATAERSNDSVLSRDREAREAAERSRARHEAVPAELSLSETIDLGPGQVALVTYDPDERRLVIRRTAP